MNCVNTEKLAGGILNIKTQQQAVWSPLGGDMRACSAEKQLRLMMCLVMGCLGEVG